MSDDPAPQRLWRSLTRSMGHLVATAPAPADDAVSRAARRETRLTPGLLPEVVEAGRRQRADAMAHALTYSPLPPSLAAQLHEVQANTFGAYPCRVRLRDGRWVDRVYAMDATAFAAFGTFWSSVDAAQHEQTVTEVVELADSPTRLPPSLAQRAYDAMESGMGYYRFKLVLRDGRSLTVMTGSWLDFLPEGLVTGDIVDLVPHGAGDDGHAEAPTYLWCFYRP